MSLDLTQFHETFYIESFEGLDDMESCLLDMDVEQDNTESINTLFRGAHSIKGGSATFGFSDVAEFTHTMETLLDEIRAGNRSMTQDDVDLFLDSVDCIRSMLGTLKNGEPIDKDSVLEIRNKLEATLNSGASQNSVNDSDLIDEDEFESLLDNIHGKGNAPGISESNSSQHSSSETITDDEFESLLDDLHGEGKGPSRAAALMQGGRYHWSIEFQPHENIFKKGNDPILLIQELSTFGNIACTAEFAEKPGLDNLVIDTCLMRWKIDLCTDCDIVQIKEVFSWVEDDSKISYTMVRDDNTVKQDTERNEGNKENNNTNSSAQPVIDDKDHNKTHVEKSQSPKAMTAKIAATPETSSIRVGIDKVDNLINMVGELVITQSMLNEITKNFEKHDISDMLEGLAQLERNSRELQESVMRIRMLPVSFAFNRFPRLVRDIGKKLGKKIDLRFTGEHTEMDKTVMEKLNDPLVHLVRNSIDHGLEKPDVRRSLGKDETGRLHMHAYHEGGKIVVEISDDGAGLDAEKLLKKAVEKGILSENDEMTEDEIHELIFHPGFSTAQEVSDLSGRGVGMDVVRRNIRSLGGNVELKSKFGSGTTVTIRLPLTLAILDGQSIQVGDEIYIIPLISIVETIKITADMVNLVGGEGEVFRLRDEYIPIVRLNEVLGSGSSISDISEGLMVVVEGDEKRVGLFVDALLGHQQVVIKSLETNYKRVDGISGATILGDGRVALIIDVSGLIRLAHNFSSLSMVMPTNINSGEEISDYGE